MSTFNRLIEFRKRLGIKQKDMARYLSISKSTLSRYERGSRKITAEYMDKYAEYLNIEIQFIIK